MGFEYWKHLRTTNLYKSSIKEIIDFFYSKYQDTSLFDLLDDVSISEDMLLEDAMSFAPNAIEHLHSTGVLDAFIRQYLEPFYHSEAARKILAE